MKRIQSLPILAVIAIAMSCNQTQTTTNNSPTANPFFEKSTLPFEAPDFSKIKNGDFQPAIEEGMKQQQAEIQKIADNTEAPTFENTLVAIEKSGQLLRRVNLVFNLLTGANTNDSLQKVQAQVSPELAANQDAIYLNSNLFKRIQAVYAQKDKLKLDPESEHLLEFYHQEFELAGANLPDSAKAKLKLLNREEAGLTTKFTQHLLAGSKAAAVLVSDKSALSGLSDDAIAAAAQNAKAAKHDGQWMLSIQNTTQQPALQSLTNRDTREKLFNASWTRTEKSDSNDTRKIILRIAQIRAEKAHLLGFKNYADWKLRDQMAKTPEAVAKFMAQLVPAATAKAKVEAAEIQSLIDKQKGGFKLQPYDWNYYSEQVRKAKYDLDENEVKPYFELNKVLQNGVFYAANQLYGLTFKERHDLPVYQPDVRVFDVMDKDGSQIGLFYCDYFKRDNKSGGAWMDNMMVQSKLLGTKPVIYNVCNFTKPAPGQPALISYDDAKTMFHEFGHALHGFFASQQYPILSGSNTARDFVEF
ncbi:MAG TPA: M3 family metallopeptidase, partial [Mucilaginibacter sp.]|nr:M3 family metallopeptidase [Mucilaginibacter sp.]